MVITAVLSAFLDNVTTMLLDRSGDYRDRLILTLNPIHPAPTRGLRFQCGRDGHSDR